MPNLNPKIKRDQEKEISTYPQLCKACGLCAEVCPRKAIFFNKKELSPSGKPTVDVDLTKCVACKQCEMICPDCAIKVKKF
ncbi:MAG: 4Fe-4S binding protein [bacterium]